MCFASKLKDEGFELWVLQAPLWLCSPPHTSSWVMKALPLVTFVLPCFLQLLCICDWSCLNHCFDDVQERAGSSSLSLGCLGFCSNSKRGNHKLFSVAEVRNANSEDALGRSSEMGRGTFRGTPHPAVSGPGKPRSS